MTKPDILDNKIEEKEAVVKSRIEEIRTQIDELKGRRVTNGYVSLQSGKSMNIFLQKTPKSLLDIANDLIKSKEHHEAAFKYLKNIPQELSGFMVERERGKPEKFEDFMSDIDISFSLLVLEAKEAALVSALSNLSKKYSDSKKREIEVNQLFSDIDNI